jgi:hypothetical protein
VNLGPDHDARLGAISRLIQLLAAGHPTAKAPEPKKYRIDDADWRR